MISGTEHQKIFVQMQDENMEIEWVPSVFRSFLGPSVVLQKDEQFCVGTVFFSMFGIIKMKLARKVSRSSLCTTDIIDVS
jgi:hypothetical protein